MGFWHGCVVLFALDRHLPKVGYELLEIGFLGAGGGFHRWNWDLFPRAERVPLTPIIKMEAPS